MDVEIDVPFSMTVQDFFKLLEKHGATIAAYTAVGPAGGNPSVMLAFGDRARAEAFLMECYPQEDLATLLKLHTA